MDSLISGLVPCWGSCLQELYAIFLSVDQRYSGSTHLRILIRVDVTGDYAPVCFVLIVGFDKQFILKSAPLILVFSSSLSISHP